MKEFIDDLIDNVYFWQGVSFGLLAAIIIMRVLKI